MKRALSLLLSLLLLGSSLAGCSSRENAPAETAAPTMIPSEPVASIAAETLPTETAAPETTPEPDVISRLENVEAEYAALQEKLMNDPSLNQADMNELAGQQFTLWDTLLNDFWVQLTADLPGEQMQQLLQKERAWIRWKESSVAIAADYYSGGSLSILATNSRAAAITRDRVYELAELLTGQALVPEAPGTDLYRQVFLPLVSLNQVPDYENLQLLLDFRGFSLLEDEGTFQISDPQKPGSYLFGSLSNESGMVTVPNMSYILAQDDSQRGVRADFFTEGADLYIDAASWDDGTPVSSVAELTEYLFS